MKLESNKFLNEALGDYPYDSNETEEVYVQKHGAEPEKVDEIEDDFDEEELLETLYKDFSSSVRDRGEAYYNDGRVHNVYKSGDKYITKVDGSDDKVYDVEIEILDQDTAYYKCDCPCDFNCKHEYAALMAISNLEYSEVELRPTIKEKDINLKEIIEYIPAEHIKEYLLSPAGLDNVAFEMKSFNNYFRIYYPRPSYDFYYNNLYNELVLDEDYISTVNSYIDRSRYFLSYNSFDEVFKIVESIIEAYNDSNRLNYDDYVFEVINKIGMLLRISYRKASDDTRKDIIVWANNLEERNYYNNYYLEDLILSLSINK